MNRIPHPTRIRIAVFAAAALVATASVAPMHDEARADEPVDFGRDVYPILRRACFECHGQRKQEGDLRLDQRQFAHSDPRILGKNGAKSSELARRISLPAGDDQIMPSRGAPLAPAEVAKIKAWIDAGAVWPDDLKVGRHWAYQPPVRLPPPTPATPPTTSPTPSDRETHNPIDAWVRARLQKEGLKFSEPADRPTILRRLSLDLVGLPPSPEEIDAFVRDQSPEAYEKVVDRLLASKQYGVRWARPWLDYARYADSHGFQRDDFRDLWPYRDWVVDALNDDMPFTQFTIEQLAGDLLPDATQSQRIATGFNRSAPTNVEAGSDPEETRVNQVHDRVNTLGMIWLGTTLECAQCHDHKYDPFTQRDYYGLFAFFNNTSLEADRTNARVPGSIQFRGPTMELVDAPTEAERERLRKRIAEVDASLASLTKEAEIGLDAWEATYRASAGKAPQEHRATIVDFESTAGATHEILADQSVLVSGEPAPEKDVYVVVARTTQTGVRGVKLELLTDDSLPGKGPGRGDQSRPNVVLNNVTVAAAPYDSPADSQNTAQPVKFVAARASFSQAKFPVANLLKSDNGPLGGWGIAPQFHEPHWVVLETDRPLDFAGGVRLTLKLEQNYGGGRTIGRLRVSVLTGEGAAGGTAAGGTAAGQPAPAELTAALAIPAERRTAQQRRTIVAHRLKDDARHTPLEKEKTQLETALRNLKTRSTLVMREDTPRTSAVFKRGDFRSPGDAVEPATPAALHSTAPPSTPRNDSRKPTRLDLARWLVSRENPLVARVVVNRWWAELFGRGLVATPEDFGLKGEAPTHPELLDWLAVEFMDDGWSQKRLLKKIVMSATYRQSSRIPSATNDDRNLLYARGPRHRLEAELIRDNALAIAGLLNPQLGGPPIKPYQPDGLWVKVGGQKYDYDVSPGAEKHRRGLYVVWKRGAPYPSFVSFDANNRMACRVHRPRSNTPLQALALMNDPVYVEAAMAFARRLLSELPSADDAARIDRAFRLAVSRGPRPDELAILSGLLNSERAARAAEPKGAVTFVGSFDVPKGVTPAEFTAWYAVAAALLNLDECISKG